MGESSVFSDNTIFFFFLVMHLPGSPGSSPEFVQGACASVFSLSIISMRVSAMFFSFLLSVSLNISSYSNFPRIMSNVFGQSFTICCWVSLLLPHHRHSVDR